MRTGQSRPADPGQIAAERALAERSDASFTDAAGWLDRIRTGSPLTSGVP